MTSFLSNVEHRLTRHLHENNQTYFEHLRDAWSYAGRSGLATIGFFVHGAFPFLFEHTGSGIIDGVNGDIQSKLSKTRSSQPASPSTT